jgi:type IX secretion system PorP/SprF family membrane protein
MKQLTLPFLFTMAACLQLAAQDPHFSQFFASPLTLNPALTGRFDGNYRIAGNYRNQWPTINNAYVTATFSADFAILQNRIAEPDRWAVGVMAFTDAQADGVLKNTFYSVSTAYHKALDEDGMHQVAIGFQGTYAQKRLNTANLKFADQLRSDGFTGITNEIFDPRALNINYLDLNAGVLFSGGFGVASNYYIGGSLYHVNKPKETFTGAQFALQPRYTLHGGLYFPVGQTATLHTSALHQGQAGARETVLGAAIGFNLNNDFDYRPATFYAGSWLRINDAVIPYVGLEFNKFRFGASYDVNVSKLRTVSNSQGGFEISLIYIGKQDGEKGISCPKF